MERVLKTIKFHGYRSQGLQFGGECDTLSRSIAQILEQLKALMGNNQITRNSLMMVYSTYKILQRNLQVV